MSDDERLQLGLAAVAVGGVGLLGVRLGNLIADRREQARVKRRLKNLLETSVDQAKNVIANEQIEPDLLEWSLSQARDGEYRFTAPIDRGEYRVEEVNPGHYRVGYTRYFTFYLRTIHEDRSPAACIVAAYHDARRSRYLGHRLKWTTDDAERVHSAESGDMLVRVRVTPWGDVFNLFVLPVRQTGVAFYHVYDGELVDAKALGALVARDGLFESTLPAVHLPTNRGMFRWRYTDTDADVIALAELGETRLELGYGPRRGVYELRGSSEQHAGVLACGPIRELLSEPRVLPGPRRHTSVTFAEFVSEQERIPATREVVSVKRALRPRPLPWIGGRTTLSRQ